MRRVGRLLALTSFAYGIVLLLFWLLQERLIYFPARELVATPAGIGLAYEDVFIDTADGVRVHGWYLAAPAARATLLFLHGNGGNISHRLERLVLFNRLGLNVLIVDYRGYGLSAARPGEAGTYRDAEAAWAYLTQTRGLAAESIVVYGESLGAAVASHVAARRRVRALILDSGFTSLADIGAEAYPWLPVRLLLRHRYASRDNLARVQAPVLVVHSRDDDIIPFHHGQRLFATAREPRQFLEIRGGHNDGFLRSAARYEQGLEMFLRSLPD